MDFIILHKQLISAKLMDVHNILPLFLLLSWPVAALGQPADAAITPTQAQALVTRALATELRASQDASHPMLYRLRKSSPRMTSTKEIAETRDGDVARLIAINDQPLNQADELQEQARLDALLADPSRSAIANKVRSQTPELFSSFCVCCPRPSLTNTPASARVQRGL